jgi:hypothetical protein
LFEVVFLFFLQKNNKFRSARSQVENVKVFTFFNKKVNGINGAISLPSFLFAQERKVAKNF